MSEWSNPDSVERLQTYCNKFYKHTILVPSGYLGERNLLKDQIQDHDIENITKENVNKFADIVFDRSTYNNTRFRAGEIILKSFDQLNSFSNTMEKII